MFEVVGGDEQTAIFIQKADGHVFGLQDLGDSVADHFHDAGQVKLGR